MHRCNHVASIHRPADYEASIAPVKRQLYSELLSGLAAQGGSASSGDALAEPAQLLELGVGTGPNLRYYAEHYQAATGIDASTAAAGTAAGAAASAGAAAGPAAADGAAAAGAAQPRQALPPLQITGIDRNNFMRPYLQQNLAASGWPAERFSWVAGDVAALPFEDASMDAVVCTLVG